MSPGRIEFVILRTGRSPPTAPHHTSLRRSCCRLQAGERLPEEDFHLSDHLRFQAHVRRPVAAFGLTNAKRRQVAVSKLLPYNLTIVEPYLLNDCWRRILCLKRRHLSEPGKTNERARRLPP